MDFIFKLFKFGIVGFSGFFVDFLSTWLCIEKLQINKYISNSIGFSIAATSNYILNRIWTFQSSSKEIVKEYAFFLFISFIGLGLNNLFIFILNGKLKINFYYSKIFAISMVVIWNFLANYYFTFRPFKL